MNLAGKERDFRQKAIAGHIYIFLKRAICSSELVQKNLELVTRNIKHTDRLPDRSWEPVCPALCAKDVLDYFL